MLRDKKGARWILSRKLSYLSHLVTVLISTIKPWSQAHWPDVTFAKLRRTLLDTRTCSQLLKIQHGMLGRKHQRNFSHSTWIRGQSRVRITLLPHPYHITSVPHRIFIIILIYNSTLNCLRQRFSFVCFKWLVLPLVNSNYQKQWVIKPIFIKTSKNTWRLKHSWS